MHSEKCQKKPHFYDIFAKERSDGLNDGICNDWRRQPDADSRFCVFNLSLSRERTLSLTKYAPVSQESVQMRSACLFKLY